MPNPNLINKPNYTTNLKFDQLMIEAYHRCGIYRPTISGDQIDDAIRSANFILVDYNNRGSNLYSIQTDIITIQQGLPSYSVPDFYEINDVTMANFLRQLGDANNIGTPATTAGGTAALAFDSDPLTSCLNTSSNGQITYTFATNPELVQFVGFITARADNQTYNLQFFYQTIVNNVATKQIVYQTGPITPFPGQPYFFFLNPAQKALRWGVEEIGGATLNMAEVFFVKYGDSRTISPLSRQDWMTLSNKNLLEPRGTTVDPLIPWPAQPPAYGNFAPVIPSPIEPAPIGFGATDGFPSGYYVDRQASPVINLYPVPGSSYPYCVFTYTSYFESVTSLQQTLKIPGSFIPAITAELAMALATKYADKKLPQLIAQRDEAFKYATDEDRQKVSFKLQCDFSQFMTN